MSRVVTASITSFVIIFALFLTCTLPTDPSKDPDNLTVTFKLPGNSNAFAQGSEVLVGLVINYPVHADSIKVSFGEIALKETVLFCQTKSTQAETLYVKCRYAEENVKTITVTVRLTKGTYKTFFQSINVFPKSLSVSFAAIQQTYLVQIYEPITLQFPASSDPTGNPIDFRVISNPPLDSTALKMVDEGTSARVTSTCTSLQQHKITCFANSSTRAYDTTEVVLIPYTRPSQSSTSGTATISAGTSDTLLFTIPTDGTSKLNFVLLDSILITQGVFKVLPLQSDTLKVVFTPHEAKTYTISFLVTNGTLSDTITFQKVVTGVQVPVWKASTATIIATEGKTVSHSFAPYLTDSTRTDMVYRASRGTISGKTVSAQVPWGSAQKDSITISADSNGIVYQFKLLLNIVSGDSALPKITLISPASNPFTTNDTKVTCKFILSDIGAGIGKVTFTKNGSAITDTSRTDSLYLCNIDSLKHGVPVIVKLVATDGSLRKNRDSLSVTITRDSTIEDKTPPTFSIVADTRVNGRVTVDTGTFKVSIEDGSGIDNGVIVKLNGTVLTGVTKTGSVYSIPYTLTAYGSNTISINATDNATAKNSDSIQIILDYNTKPSQLIPGSPENDTTNVDTLPTFSWTGGDDADNDTVSYGVVYGTSQSSLTGQSPVVKNPTKSVTLTSKLTTNRTYYWKVIGYTTGTYKDTVSSAVSSFTTVNPDRTNPTLTVTSAYTEGMRVTNAANNVTFTASDANGIDSAYYTINNNAAKTTVTGTGGTYTFQYTLTRRGLDTINIVVVDGSALHNRTPYRMIVTYNSLLSGTISLGSPTSNATEVAVLAPFSWTAVSDPDDDIVYYTIEYSTSADFSNSTVSQEVSVNNLTLRAGEELDYNTRYQYRLICYTKVPFQDTIRSSSRYFTTFNRVPTVTLSTPINDITRINPINVSASFTGSDPDGNTLTYSLAVSTSASNIMSSSMRVDNLTTTSYPLSSFALNNATRYYWQVIAVDNGTIPKRDTSDVFSFYTLNRAPVWTTIPSKDSVYYRCTINLAQFCSDPDGNSVTYSAFSSPNATVSENTLICASDSQLITVRAIDNFSAQPCTSQTTFWRGFVNPALMKPIPAQNQTFRMGGESFTPVHEVNFTYNFWMDSVEVTQTDFVNKMQFNPSATTSVTGNHIYPVETITWYDAVLYCNARSKAYGLDTVYTYTSRIGTPGTSCSSLGGLTIDYSRDGFRLPTEAEWEFACRAGTTTKYHWGTDPTIMSLYAYTSSIGGTNDVAKLRPNNFGLYDILGNVQEFCNDFFYDPYPEEIQTNPIGPPTGNGGRIIRGGQFRLENTGEHTYCAYRNSNSEDAGWDQLGFRCVRGKF